MTAIALAAMLGSCSWACSSTAGALPVLAASCGFAAPLEAPAAGCCLFGLSVLACFLLTVAAEPARRLPVKAGALPSLVASGGFAASVEVPAAGCCLCGLSVLLCFLLTMAAAFSRHSGPAFAGAAVLGEPRGAEACIGAAEATCTEGRPPCFSSCMSGVLQAGRESGIGCIDAAGPAASPS